MHKLLKQAFTLIELLVVIAIIGILSGLIIVGMSGMTQKATIAKAQVFSNSLRNSLMMNIVGEWKFDGATSERPAVNADVVDSWGGVNNGTIPASPSIPTIKTESNCVSGSCLSFDGVDDYVDCGSGASLQLTSIGTVSLWFKSISAFSGNTGTKKYLMFGGPIDFYFSSTSSLLLYFLADDSTSCRSDSSSWDTNWHYVVVTSDGTTVKMYINSVFQTNTGVATGKNFFGNVGHLTINKITAGFPGLVDDVRIYNAAIPTSQIKEQYYAGLNKLFANGGITKEDYQNRMGELAMGL